MSRREERALSIYWIDLLILALVVAVVAALIRQSRARKRRWRELITTITKPRKDENPKEERGREGTSRETKWPT
jgi:hypothetical protein